MKFCLPDKYSLSTVKYRRLHPDLGHLLRSIILIDASDVQPQKLSLSVALVVRQRTSLIANASELFHGEMIQVDPWHWLAHTSNLERLNISAFSSFFAETVSRSNRPHVYKMELYFGDAWSPYLFLGRHSRDVMIGTCESRRGQIPMSAWSWEPRPSLFAWRLIVASDFPVVGVW